MSATAYPATPTPAVTVPWPSIIRRAVPALDVRRLVRDAALIVGLLLTNKLGTPGSVLFFAILVVMVFRSPEAAFKAVAICYLGLMLNQAFVPKSLVWTPGRLAIPYLAMFRFALDMGALRLSVFSRRSYLAFLLFVATMAVCSLASGWYTHIALLKLTNFFIFITMLFSAVMILRARRSDIGEWMVSLILSATFFGLAAIALGESTNYKNIPEAANAPVASGFNGAFLHPNVHATYASLLIAFLASVWILGRYRKTWLTLPLMACWFTFIGYSASRTALISSIAPILLLFAYAKPIRNRLGWRLLPNVSRGTLLATGVTAAVVLFVWDAASGGSISQSIVSFINKGAGPEATLNTEQIISSRKALVEYSIKNFKDNMVFGIGFGVAKTQAFVNMATLFSAPAEKGFLPSAILEEGGILGTTAFLVFLCVFLREFIRERNVAGLIVFLTFLMTNFGEVTIFAPGGGGSFGWTMVGAAMVFGDRCWAPPSAFVGRTSARVAPIC